MPRKNRIKHGFVPRDRSSDDFDWNKGSPVAFPNLKPSSTTISLRMTDSMLNEIKLLANKRDVPYQSLIKMILAERIQAMK